MSAEDVYSFDTSALIDGLERFYPEASFPSLWQRVDELIASARLVISEEVWEEVKQKDAVAREWCEPRLERIVVPTDRNVARQVTFVLKDHERLVGQKKGRNRADPFVIAVAQIRSAVVVTGEGDDGNARRPKIPYVCAELGVPCLRLLQVIQAEGWGF